MGMATSKVRLNICGSSYVVNTSESEDYMKNLADRLNLDMNELMASSNSVSITTAAVMTALNYRDELEKASGSADNMRRQIKDYLEDAASAKMAAEEASFNTSIDWMSLTEMSEMRSTGNPSTI
jgi:cell division protein ZapA